VAASLLSLAWSVCYSRNIRRAGHYPSQSAARLTKVSRGMTVSRRAYLLALALMVGVLLASELVFLPANMTQLGGPIFPEETELQR
jgi:hypothetical protein